MTVEKAIVAGWTRIPGWETDNDLRDFARALARKRSRYAFPDDFVAAARSLQERLTDKHNKQTDEGPIFERFTKSACAPRHPGTMVRSS